MLDGRASFFSAHWQDSLSEDDILRCFLTSLQIRFMQIAEERKLRGQHQKRGGNLCMSVTYSEISGHRPGRFHERYANATNSGNNRGAQLFPYLYGN
jgi:hypothetical protein